MRKKIIISLLLISNLSLAFVCLANSAESDKAVHSQKKQNAINRLLHSVLDRGNGFKTPFSRGAGHWSTPDDEKDITYFGRLAESESQRENWYQVTPYISEFWCALSNAGLIYVGLKHKSPELLAAGVASFAYHSCPKQWLLHVDRAAVGLTLIKFVREYEVVKKNPQFLAMPVAVAAINGLDEYLGRYKGKTWPHVAWHLSAAWMANKFLTYAKN